MQTQAFTSITLTSLLHPLSSGYHKTLKINQSHEKELKISIPRQFESFSFIIALLKRKIFKTPLETNNNFFGKFLMMVVHVLYTFIQKTFQTREIDRHITGLFVYHTILFYFLNEGEFKEKVPIKVKYYISLASLAYHSNNYLSGKYYLRLGASFDGTDEPFHSFI